MPRRSPSKKALPNSRTVCPTVGGRTGASFVQHGVTGFLVDRLPPGRQCVASEDDEAGLATYLEAVRKALAMDRQAVRAAAAERFATDSVVSAILNSLHRCRWFASKAEAA